MSDLRYTDDHEWVRLDGDTAIIGISQYAQEQLGDIVFVELPESGQEVSQGEEIAVIESVKAAGGLKCPVDGTISDVNEALADAPETVNDSPEEAGWFCKITVSSPDQISTLKDAAAYQNFLEEIA